MDIVNKNPTTGDENTENTGNPVASVHLWRKNRVTDTDTEPSIPSKVLSIYGNNMKSIQ
jgi:hypothetical protein